MADTRVLLVDDDEVVRMSLSFVLEQSGFTLTSAASVPEALKYISSENYGVLLSDFAKQPGEHRLQRAVSRSHDHRR